MSLLCLSVTRGRSHEAAREPCWVRSQKADRKKASLRRDGCGPKELDDTRSAGTNVVWDGMEIDWFGVVSRS